MFEIWTRGNNEEQTEWTLYGRFNSEVDFGKELENIRYLGLYTKRVKVTPQE